jgi:phosphoribosylformylglycinamidine cyclo-ligase
MLTAAGIDTWTLGEIEPAPSDLSGYVHGAKGVDGGAVRLVGDYA